MSIGISVAMIRTLVVAFVMVVMWGVVSLNGDAEQEWFNRVGICVTVAVAGVYVGASLMVLRWAAVAGGSGAFVRWGGLVMLLAAQVLYFVIASVLARRVM